MRGGFPAVARRCDVVSVPGWPLRVKESQPLPMAEGLGLNTSSISQTVRDRVCDNSGVDAVVPRFGVRSTTGLRDNLECSMWTDPLCVNRSCKWRHSLGTKCHRDYGHKGPKCDVPIGSGRTHAPYSVRNGCLDATGRQRGWGRQSRALHLSHREACR